MITIECLTSMAELLALKHPYGALIRSIANVPIFLDWHWITAWLRVYHRNLSPWILVARRENDQIVGIAPWMIVNHRMGPARLRRVTFIGSGDIYPCHLSVLAEENQCTEISRAFWFYLDAHSRDWDVIDLDSSASNCSFRQNIDVASGHVFEKESFCCHFISLPESWQLYQDRLSKKLRRNLRYYLNRLEREKAGAIHFERITAEDELEAAMDSLIAINRKRWHQKEETSAFDDSRFVRFHREMTHVALEQGWLRFFQLKVADTVIAALYAFRYQGVYYVYQMGFDPSWSRYSPGRLLIAHVIRQAIEEGARTVDWLRGDQHFKRAWANDSHTNYHLVFGKNFRAHLLVSMKSYRHRAKLFLKTLK